MREFRKRLLDSSGNSVYLTLLVLDSLMKNCASDVHAEVLCVEFMTVLKTVITTSKVRLPSTYALPSQLTAHNGRMERVRKPLTRLWS